MYTYIIIIYTCAYVCICTRHDPLCSCYILQLRDGISIIIMPVAIACKCRHCGAPDTLQDPVYEYLAL